MKDSAEIETIILHFLQKDITKEEMQQLINWIDESRENKQTFFQLKKIYDKSNVALYPSAEQIKKGKKHLIHILKEEENIRRRKSQIYSFIKYMAVAIVACTLTLVVKYFNNNHSIGFIELNVESGPRQSRMTLPDGSKVVLNASTIIRFPEKFDKQVREVHLDGEAFFEVAENKKVPFIVYTNKQKVEVLGTQFNIMDYTADDYAITTLVSGKIKMQPYTENGEWGEEILLKPNQQIFFNNQTTQLALSDIKIDPKRTWVNKVYHFKAEPLYQITKRLEKIYGIKINIVNEDLKNVEYTGTFGLDQEIEAVLKIINFDRQFSYTQTDDEILIQ